MSKKETSQGIGNCIFGKNKVLKLQPGLISLLFVLALTSFALPLWSKPIDENMARKVAIQWLTNVSETQNAEETSQIKSLKLIYKSSNKTINNAMQENTAETVYFYIFVTEDNTGFVIVSGDDRVVPVLGYSNSNGFSVENMPDNIKWWLGEYAKQIEFAIENNIEPADETKQQWIKLLENKENSNDKK